MAYVRYAIRSGGAMATTVMRSAAGIRYPHYPAWLRAGLLAVLLGLSGVSWAQPLVSSFNINIQLMTDRTPLSGGFCISRELSELTQAWVTVTCDRGQFVRIGPAPDDRGRPVHSATSRYALLTGGGLGLLGNSALSTLTDARAGAGTVTSLHVLRGGGSVDVLEMWIYF